MNIYVGNFPYAVSEEDLRQAFQAFGNVTTVSVIKDKFSGQSKGFGFVEMPDQAQAQAAIEGLNGKELQGRALTVNEARPKESRPSGQRSGGQQSYGNSRSSFGDNRPPSRDRGWGSKNDGRRNDRGRDSGRRGGRSSW